MLLSKATAYNWKKLNSDSKCKLTKRANKTQSVKRIVASSYVNDADANMLLSAVSELNDSIESIMYSLIISLFTQKRIIHKPHVREFLKRYRNVRPAEIVVPGHVWESGEDVLGFIYQSLLTNGIKPSPV